MFIKIIISLMGFIFLVDSAVGNCGRCQTNHVACHSEDTFSLCVEGNPTDSVVRCPKNKVCTNDQAICVEKGNDGLIAPSCMTGKLPMEIGSYYETQDVVKTQHSTVAVVFDEEIATTDKPSTSEPSEEGGISLSTQYSDPTTVDSTVIGVSDGIISTTTDETFTTDQEDKDSSTIEELNTSTYTSVTDEEITSVTEDISTPESADLSSSSTQNISSGDISTTDTSISDIPSTDVSISDISTTNIPNSDISTTDVSISDISTTDVSSSDISTTDVSSGDISTTDTSISDIFTTDVSSSDISTTDVSSGDISTIDTSISDISTTDVSSSDIDISTTDVSISDISTTDVSISDMSTTDILTTDIEISSSATSSAPRDATTFCSENKDIGTFKAEGDTTCKKYYICTTYKDGFRGYEFNCGEENYFNSETSLCQKEKPDDC